MIFYDKIFLQGLLMVKESKSERGEGSGSWGDQTRRWRFDVYDVSYFYSFHSPMDFQVHLYVIKDFISINDRVYWFV